MRRRTKEITLAAAISIAAGFAAFVPGTLAGEDEAASVRLAASAPGPAIKPETLSAERPETLLDARARATIAELLDRNTLPIVNENDTVATEKLRYGDNDRLAARVAQLVGADLLIILSDVDGLYDADPSTDPDAEHIPFVEEVTEEITDLAGPTRAETAGTGGMATKIAAAEMAMSAGCSTVITRGDREQPITALLDGERATWFQAEVSPESAKRIWIASALAPEGKLFLDEGASEAVRAGHSLLAAGITDVEGQFGRGHAIRLVDHSGEEIATALPGYDSDECRVIAGAQSDEIETRLGYKRGYALVHASDLVLDDPKVKLDEGVTS